MWVARFRGRLCYTKKPKGFLKKRKKRKKNKKNKKIQVYKKINSILNIFLLVLGLQA